MYPFDYGGGIGGGDEDAPMTQRPVSPTAGTRSSGSHYRPPQDHCKAVNEVDKEEAIKWAAMTIVIDDRWVLLAGAGMVGDRRLPLEEILHLNNDICGLANPSRGGFKSRWSSDNLRIIGKPKTFFRKAKQTG